MKHPYNLAINPQLLPAFLAVADHKTTTNASAVLHIAQPTVTEHINRLEKEIGNHLFKRSVKGMQLTDVGRQFYPYAKQLLATMQEALNATNVQADLSGILSLTASTTVADYVLPHLLASFYQKHPKLSIQLKSLNTAQTLEAIDQGSTQLGLIEGHSAWPHILLTPFIQDDIILVGAPFKHYAVAKITDMQKLPFIWRERGSGTRDVIEKALTKQGVDIAAIQPFCEINSTEAIKQSVAKHLGVAFMSKWAVAKELSSGQLQHIRVPGLNINRLFYWVQSSGTLPLLHQTFIKHAETTIQPLPSFSGESSFSI